MDKKAIAAVLEYVLKMKFVEGYRTYISVVGLLALAVYLLTQGSYEQAVTNFSLALAALGLRDGNYPPKPEEPKAEPEPHSGPQGTL